MLTQLQKQSIMRIIKPAFDTDESKSLSLLAKEILDQISPQIVYTTDGAIEATDHTAVLVKAGDPLVMTLAVPPNNGVRIKLIHDGTGSDHTITSAAGFKGAFGSGTTITIYQNNTVFLESFGGSWYYLGGADVS
jgi:hypothetical protein